VSVWGELFIAIAMAIGILGTIVPSLPGIALTWTALFAWAILDGGGTTRWILFLLASTLFAIAMITRVVLPASVVSKIESNSIFVSLVMGTIGFFVIPVIGLPLGYALGVFITESGRERNINIAWQRTWNTLRAFGYATITQMACAMGIAFLWLTGLILT
jgi:uncharacterized protein YqgC (DUF456 family)